MTTLVFPGQGSQYVGMASEFYDNFAESRQILDQIEEITKINIKDIIFKNKDDRLNITKFTQLSIFSVSMMIYEIFKKNFKKSIPSEINFVLGHSLGEYSALVVSQCISLEECSNILKIRGELMQNAYPENMSGMYAIIGLGCSDVEKIIRDNKLDVQVANDNAPGQVVISGKNENLIETEKKFLENGAKKTVKLNVSAAFHSNLMKEAEEKLSINLKKIIFREPSIPIISNYSSISNTNKEKIFENLQKQMSNKVRWTESVEFLDKMKEKTIIEIGPGKVLSGLIKRISNNFNLYNINKPHDIDKINNEL